MKKILYTLAAVATLFTACNKDEGMPEASDNVPVQFTTAITKAAGATWGNTDQIGVFMMNNGTALATTNIADNVKYTNSASGFSSTSPIYYPQSGAVDFVAYYPYQASLATNYTYKIDVVTQTNPAAIDLLYSANATNKSRSTSAVGLTFVHKLSRVVVNIKKGTGVTDLSGLTVKIAGMPTKADFALTGGTLSNLTAIANITPITIGTTTNFDATLAAIVIPQPGTSGRTIVFTLGGQEYTYTITNTDDFLSGKTHPYNITINKTGITVDRGTITDWISMGNSTDLGTASEAIKLVLEGYTGTATVKYTDTGIQPITVFFGSNGIAGLPYTSTRDKTIRSITPDGGSEIFIGRKEYPVINLKFSENKLVLRDAVNGTIPIGSYSEFQLINSTAQTLVGSYKQEANLDLMSVEWIPIGSEAKQFKGIFDGNNLLLENILINRIGTTTADYNTGLFGYSGGTLKNIHLASGSVNGRAFTGGVCGKSIGTDATPAMIYNCTNESDVTATIDNTGGICGWNEKGTIDRCFNSANSTIKGTYRVGGVCGPNKGSITACKNSGKIEGSDYAGGVCGENGHGGTIISCYNTGTVNGNVYVGGVCGYNFSSISACYNIAQVTGVNGLKIGGVNGLNVAATVNCYWLQVSGGATYGIGRTDSGNLETNVNATPFENGAWPNSTMTGWTINTAGAGQTPNGNWKSLGSWNNGSPVFPKLWWE